MEVKNPLQDNRHVQHILLFIQQVCKVKPPCALLQDAGAHNLSCGLYHTALDTRKQVGNYGNFVPSLLVSTPASSSHKAQPDKH